MTPRKYDLGKRAAAIEYTKRRIIAATFALHNEQGVAATTLPEVARRADVALGTVHKHFPTVDDLISACGGHVVAILRPPGPDIFAGLDDTEARARALVRELFAMYERGHLQIAVARCEQDKVPALKQFVDAQARGHDAIVREGLRPARPDADTVRSTLALTDFYTWKAFADKGVSTRHAAEIISVFVLARIESAAARKGTRR